MSLIDNGSCDLTSDAVFTNVLKFTTWINQIILCSERILSETREILENFSTQVSSHFHSLKINLQSRANEHKDEFAAWKNQTAAGLKLFGVQGNEISQLISKELDRMIKDFVKEFSEETLQPKISIGIHYMQSNYVDSVHGYINLLKTAIERNSQAQNCWNDNKKNFKDIFDNAASEMRTAFEQNVVKLDSLIQTTAQLFNEALLRTYGDVKIECGTENTCIYNYVRFWLFT